MNKNDKHIQLLQLKINKIKNKNKIKANSKYE